MLEVRRLLFELPGVKDVYASSSFQIVEVTFDETQVAPASIEACLGGAGYLGELELPVETGVERMTANGKPFFRRSVAVASIKKAGFLQETPRPTRALWPCPGIDPVRIPDEEEVNG